MDWTNILIALISAIGVIISAYIAKQQPRTPHVEKGVELIERWDNLVRHAHESVGAQVSALWGFSNGKKYYDGTHAQVMNLLSCQDDEANHDDYLSLQNIPIRVMLRYIKNLQPNTIAYFDENQSRNVIARNHVQSGINTVAIYPVYDRRKVLKWFRRERLIQVVILKFTEKDHRLTAEELTDIELVALSLSTIKIKE